MGAMCGVVWFKGGGVCIFCDIHTDGHMPGWLSLGRKNTHLKARSLLLVVQMSKLSCEVYAG